MIGYGWKDLEDKMLWAIVKYYPDADSRATAYEVSVFDHHGRETIAKSKTADLALSIAINDWVNRYENTPDA